MQLSLVAAIDLQRFELPVDDPVFLNSTQRVEFELDHLLSLFVELAWREDFDHQFRRNDQVACLIKAISYDSMTSEAQL